MIGKINQKKFLFAEVLVGMGRNTHSKRTKRNKHARIKLVEPYEVEQHRVIYADLMKRVEEENEAAKELAKNLAQLDKMDEGSDDEKKVETKKETRKKRKQKVKITMVN